MKKRFFLAILLLTVSVSAFSFAIAIPPLLAGTASILARLVGSSSTLTVPIGGMSLGAAVVGVFHRLSSGKTVWVSPFDANTEPNPDISTAPHVPSTGRPIVIGTTTYPSVSPVVSDGCNGRCDFQYDVVKEIEYVLSAFHGFNIKFLTPESDPVNWAYTYNTSSSCKASPCIVLRSSAATSGTLPSNIGKNSTSYFIPLSTTVGSVRCEAPAVYDYAVASCITPAGSSEAMADGVCRISWSPVNGCPIKSPFDPDCITPEAQISLSCGTPTTPPAVKIRDLASPDQKETEVSRPHAPAQGTPGSLSIKERTADPESNTTTERRTDTSAPPMAGSPPVIQGTGQNVLPGVGTNVGATPLDQVAISNWPSSLNVNCTNCTSAPITFPETMKIDGEVPEGTELPETPELEVSGFLDPIKDRFASLTGLQFPAHTAKCPVLAIKFNVGSQVVDQSSTFMCDLLEEQRAAIQMLMALAFTGLAISIVLRS